MLFSVRFADKDNSGKLAIEPLEVAEIEGVELQYQEYLGSKSYYPFGLAFSHNAVTTEDGNLFWVDEEGGVKNRYTYNGKEFIDDLNINLHDYGFRYYDPTIARFTTIDPIAEANHYQSGFVYADNNPISKIDFMGLEGASVADMDKFNKAKSLATVVYSATDPPNTVNGWTGEYSNGGQQHTWTKGNRQIVQQWNSDEGRWLQSERDIGQTGTGNGLSVGDAAGGISPETRQTIRIINGMLSPFLMLPLDVGFAGAQGVSYVARGASVTKGGTKLLTQGIFPNVIKKFGKHADEWSQWGSISQQAYLKRAINLVNSRVGGHIRGFTSNKGWTFRFNSRTGEFLTTHPNGHIETLFRPKNGLDYYLKQVKLYGN